MATIKLFESWLKDQLNTINENHEANPHETNDAAINAYDAFRTKPEAKQFRLFTDLASKSGLTSLGTDDMPEILFALMKNGQVGKKGFLGIGKVSNSDLVNKTLDALATGKATLSYEQGYADYVPTSGGYVRTAGRVAGDYLINTDPSENQSSSAKSNLCNFMNFYNVNAFKLGQPQFVLSQRLDENGYLDLVSAPDVTGDTLYLYAAKIGAQVTATKNVQTTTTQVGGETAVSGNFAAEFDQGSDVVNAKVQAEVAKAVELCLTKFPAGKRPDKFTLTSGASTEYNGKQMPQATGVGAVKPVDDATKNQDLAYRRGVAFMNALNAGLKAKSHPGFDSFEIAWSIGKSGKQANPADRFVNLELQKNAVKPVAKETSSVTVNQTGSTTQSGTAKAQLFELKLKLSAQPQLTNMAAPAEKTSVATPTTK